MSNTNIFDSNNETNSSCATINMTQDDYVSETMVTWATSIAVSILCLVAFVKLFFFPKLPRSTTNKWCTFWPRFLEECLVPSFFLIFSYLYGVSGIAQSQGDFDREDDGFLTQYSHGAIPLVSGLFAVLVGLDLLKIYSSSKLRSRKVVWWLCVLLYYGFAIIGAIRDVQVLGVVDLRTLVSIYGLTFLLVTYVAQAMTSKYHRFHYLLKASSLFLFIIGFTYESFFFPFCGSYQAYQDCFEECTLPINPNQKFTLNVAAMLATFCWAWSENSFPSIQRRMIRPSNDGDTVASEDDSSVASSLEGDLEKVRSSSLEDIVLDSELGSPVENHERKECKVAIDSTQSKVGPNSISESDQCISTRPTLESIEIDPELALPPVENNDSKVDVPTKQEPTKVVMNSTQCQNSIDGSCPETK